MKIEPLAMKGLKIYINKYLKKCCEEHFIFNVALVPKLSKGTNVLRPYLSMLDAKIMKKRCFNRKWGRGEEDFWYGLPICRDCIFI
jgi:hypothetical protein